MLKHKKHPYLLGHLYLILSHWIAWVFSVAMDLQVLNANCVDCLVVGGCSKVQCSPNFFDDDGDPLNGPSTISC